MNEQNNETSDSTIGQTATEQTTETAAAPKAKRIRKPKASKTPKADDTATVARVEGKQQCRVVAQTRRGKFIGSTPVRNSTPDKATAIVGFQRRSFFGKNGSAPDTMKAAIKAAGEDVAYVLQWLQGTKWVDHKAPEAKA